MMVTLFTYLLHVISIQQKIITYLIGVVTGKSMARSAYDEPVRKPYRKLQVDEMPKIEIPEKLRYEDLLQAHLREKGKPLKPVQRRASSQARVPNTLSCPRCGAPHTFLYDNTGGRGQFKCKVCACCFNFKNYYSKAAILKCPHCDKTLERIKQRKDFDIFKCKNNTCPFYQRNLKAMTSAEKKRFRADPHDFKVRYIYRQFNFDYKPLEKSSPVVPKVDLSKVYASPHTLGLILTYHVNYGLQRVRRQGLCGMYITCRFRIKRCLIMRMRLPRS